MWKSTCWVGLRRYNPPEIRSWLGLALVEKSPTYSTNTRGIWVEPKLLAEIEYRAKSAEGKVRHPFFRGLREDL
jgi:ATP-dependent DNA ligase